jgi:hypothetical protein
MIVKVETWEVLDGDDRRKFSNRFDALRYGVRSQGMVDIELWHHTGRRLENGFAYEGERSLEMVESVTLYENADHPWLQFGFDGWRDLQEQVAKDIARGEGVIRNPARGWGEVVLLDYMIQAQQLMDESGIRRIDL